MISKKHCFWLLVLPFYFLYAQNDSIIFLDSCVIIAPTLDNKINSQTELTSVYEFDKKQLNNHNASQLSDVIDKIPSITLKDYGGIGGLKTISVRSLGANHTKIMLDGIPLINTETGQIDLGKIPVENISSFSLSNQQWNAPLQTAHAYSGGSVLSIISTAETNFKKKNHYSAGLQQGSFGFWKGCFDWKHQLDSTSFFTFYSHFRSAHGIYSFTFDNGKTQEKLQRNNSDILDKQAVLSYGKKWKNTKLNTKFFYTDSERGLPSAVILYNPTVGDRLWDKQFFIQNKIERKNKKTEFNWVSKYNYSWKKYLSPNFHNINQKIEDIYHQQTLYNSLAFSYQLAERWKLFYSSDYDFSWLKSNVEEHATPIRNTFLNVIGTSYQFKKIKVETNLLYTTINENTKINEKKSVQKGKLTPSISIGYKPIWERDLRLRFSYKQSYRYPTFNDLYYVRVGNINLRPELATQWNTGINYLFKGQDLFFIQKLNFKLDAFLYEIEDKIVAIPTQNLFVWSMQNFGRVQTKGFEAYINIYFKQYKHFLVDISVGYSFQQALDKTNPNSSTYNHQIPYIPFETSNSHININYKKWVLSWNYTYAGHRFFLAENTYKNTLHAWQLHDIGLEYKNIKQKYTWRIKSSVNNILNTDYQVIINYPMPKINYRLSLFIEF